MSSNRKPAAKDQTRLDDEENFDVSLPSTLGNEGGVDRNEDTVQDTSSSSSFENFSALSASSAFHDYIVGLMPPFPTMELELMVDTTKSTEGDDNANARRPAGIEQTDDQNGPSTSVTASIMIFETTQSIGEYDDRANVRRPAGVEQIEEDMSMVPLPPAAVAMAFGDIVSEKRRPAVEQTEEDMSTVPLPPAAVAMAFGDNVSKKVDKKIGHRSSNVGGKQIAPAPYSAMSGLPLTSIDEVIDRAEVDHEGEEDAPQEEDNINSTRTIDFGTSRDIEEQTNLANVNLNPIQGDSQSESPPHDVTEAYAVDDNLIIATPAEPVIPWWKQRRTKFLIAFVVVVVALSAIAIGVAMSSRKTVTETVTEVVPIAAATAFPSFSVGPTSSQVPSSLPSSCSFTISTNLQKLDLLRPNPDSVMAAIDGRNLVVVSRDALETNFFKSDSWGSLYVIFYSLSDDNEWSRSGSFIEGNIDWTRGTFDYYGPPYDIAISGQTVIVGLPGENVVHVYETNQFGHWTKIESLRPSSLHGLCGFGKSVDIDGDLLVVVDSFDCASCLSAGVYVFKKFGGDWLEIQRITDTSTDEELSIGKCFVNGDTIAISNGWWIGENVAIYIFKYNEFDDSVSLQQKVASASLDIFGDEPIKAMNDDHLLFSNALGNHIYHRQGANEPFTPLQVFNSSDAVAMVRDILVARGVGKTHLFSKQTGDLWEEVLTLEQSYDSYHLSGRTLIAVDQSEVHVMDVAGCTQPVPTQMPSTSTAPTTCYWVEFQYSAVNEHMYFASAWEAAIQKFESDLVLVNFFDECSLTACLQQGQYQFIFSGTGYDGQLLNAQFSLKSNGKVIAEIVGVPREFFSKNWIEEFNNVTIFDIPFERSIEQER